MCPVPRRLLQVCKQSSRDDFSSRAGSDYDVGDARKRSSSETRRAYYSSSQGRCIDCPAPTELITSLGLPLLVAGGLLVVAFPALLLRRRFAERLKVPIAAAMRLVIRIQQLDLVPKVKLVLCGGLNPGLADRCATRKSSDPMAAQLFTFFQLAATLPTVYNVALPDIYHSSVAVFSWVSADWDNYVFPGQCIEAGFRNRLLLRALAPLVIIGALPIGTVALFACLRRPRFFRAAMATSLPAVLFATFVLCPGVSKGVFASWDCVSFQLDASNGTERSFLAEDLTVVCIDAGERTEYHRTKIASLAAIFVLVWPVGSASLPPPLQHTAVHLLCQHWTGTAALMCLGIPTSHSATAVSRGAHPQPRGASPATQDPDGTCDRLPTQGVRASLLLVGGTTDG